MNMKELTSFSFCVTSYNTFAMVLFSLIVKLPPGNIFEAFILIFFHPTALISLLLVAILTTLTSLILILLYLKKREFRFALVNLVIILFNIYYFDFAFKLLSVQ